MKNPTSYPDLNAVLRELVAGIQAVLGEIFLSAYLQGSFAVGDWDIHSDVDFVVALSRDVTEAEAAGLQAMHTRIYEMESPWAQHLEGSYFPKELLKCDDPAKTPLLYLDNAHEKLIRSDHDNSLVVRWVVREHGITLAGPPPEALVDPVSADDLRREVLTVMHNWSDDIFSGRWQMDNKWA